MEGPQRTVVLLTNERHVAYGSLCLLRREAANFTKSRLLKISIEICNLLVVLCV